MGDLTYIAAIIALIYWGFSSCSAANEEKDRVRIEAAQALHEARVCKRDLGYLEDRIADIESKLDM